MSAEIFTHQYANGLTLLAEHMPDVRSAAVNIMVPAGCVYDPPELQGLASLLCDLIPRGAGSRGSRALSLALDQLGMDRDESVGLINLGFQGATLARNLPAGLELFADMLRRPHLPAEDLESVRQLGLQRLDALEDDPQQLVKVEFRRRLYPEPMNRDALGTREGIQAISIDAIHAHYQRCFRPQGIILAVAGNIEWQALRQQVGELLGDWQGPADALPQFGPNRQVRDHLVKPDKQQTQIMLAWPSVPPTDADFYAARGVVGVLSGGMASRLFTEVRENRGLCYAIHAFLEPARDRGTLFCYAGTRAERAQETLDVTLTELHKLRDGFSEDELLRVRARLKSVLIMQQESAGARASSLTSDWFYLGRIRSVEEIQKAVDGLSPTVLAEHLERYPICNVSILTLGPEPLILPGD